MNFDGSDSSNSQFQLKSVLMPALVLKNKDFGAGRIRIKLPGMSDDDIGLWARPAVLMGGAGRGTFFLPEEGDEVLVAFDEIGDAYILGGLWNGVDNPPDTNADGQNNKRFIKSRSGHLIRLDDTDGAEKIEIIDKSGNNTLTFDTANNTITIASAKDINLQAPQGNITLNAKALSISSTGDTSINAQGQATVEASGSTTIKGSTVNIN